MITHTRVEEKPKPVRLTERDETTEARRAMVNALLLDAAEKHERPLVMKEILRSPEVSQ